MSSKIVCDGQQPSTSGTLQKGEVRVEEAIDGRRRCREFKLPETDRTLNSISKKNFAPKSKSKIMWAVNMYSEWRRNRLAMPLCPPEIINANLDMVGTFAKNDLCHSLSRFIREVKKLDGSEYPPNTVRDLVLMVQMYLHENSVYWKLLDQEEFIYLRNVVDNTMKERHAQGLGVRQSSDIISLDHENQMFNQGILSEDNAGQLLKTVIYMIGLHCALRGGLEHSNLRCPGCKSQFSFERDVRGIERLVYREDLLHKTNQGGLMSKGKPKTVFIHPADNVLRCPVRLVKKYFSLLPESRKCTKLYLRCRKRPSLKTWYCDQPYGVNKIKNTVKEICKQAGIEGKFTNHSLRATCASRMYDKNVPEQIIKETTGHKSECVRVYKRTSEALQESASKTVSATESHKRPKLDIDSSEEEDRKDIDFLSYEKMVENVKKTKEEMRQKLVKRSKWKARRLVKRAQRLSLDLNLNVKVDK